MKSNFILTINLIFIVLLGACRQNAATTTSPDIAHKSESISTGTDSNASESAAQNETLSIHSSPILVSELLTGVPGGNNHEFIELYNSGEQAIDLNGWSLWYLTRTNQEPSLVYSWTKQAEIPGHGHYLLVREGEFFDIHPDATYDIALFEGKGGIILQNAEGEIVERFGWGDAPESYFAQSPMTDFAKGESFERLPGGENGNGINSGHNAVDFTTLPEPNPQNTGSLPTPLPDERLSISLDIPESIPPGTEFDMGVIIQNLASQAQPNVTVILPVADHFSLVELPPGAELIDGRISWVIDMIEPGESATNFLRLATPFVNVDTLMSGYYAESAELPRTYGALQVIPMDGSAIPINVARSLPIGSIVTIEGLVTMYPGGFFAGSSSAKFYVEDETGGVQVFADGGRFDVSVNIGQRVQVTGRTELFRDSLEVIPRDNVADIKTLAVTNQPPEPAEITILDNQTNEEVLGRLNVIQGEIVGTEEFTFHYEVDLTDKAGNQTLVFIEKDTGINVDPMQIGSLYRITGISELASGQRQIKPRLQSDIVEVFPAVLLLETEGPSNILPGETMTLTITAVNHTEPAMTNVLISASQINGTSEEWLIPRLDGEGGRESVYYVIQIPETETGKVELGPFSATSDQWLEPTVAPVHQTFIGRGVPIWAIQGQGSRSPFIGQRVSTTGLVTGIFPQMHGFFLQSLEPDGNPRSSDGIFVSTENFGHQVKEGEVIEVSGRVREDAGQTIIRPATPSDIVILKERSGEIIEPVSYDPPQNFEEAKNYKESLEGMLVIVDMPTTVIAPTNRFGEYAIVLDKWGIDRVSRRDGPVGNVIWVDDGTFNSYEDQTELPVAVARGDVVSNVAGPLAYTFGNFKIAPLEQPEFTKLEHPLPIIPEATASQFSVATFNVENLFDSEFPFPDSPPMLSEDEYRFRLNKVAESIVAMGAPTIIALQEVENIHVLEALIAQPQLADYDYQPILMEGNDSRGIDVGYLVRTDRALVRDFSIYDAPGELFSRPPLVLYATVQLPSGDQEVILLNNHFLSLAAGEEQTEPTRDTQAAWNVTALEQLRINNPEAHYIVLGDLNSFYPSKPIETIQEFGLRHAYESFTEDDVLPYTYIFDGATQTLDHILMSESLFQNLIRVEALHINADYPIAHPNDASARRTSDHDPLVVIFAFD